MKTPEEFAEQCGLAYAAKFIPHSQSRNKDSKHQQINWLITLSKGNNASLQLEFDYSQGVAHLPWFIHSPKDKHTYRACVTKAVEENKWFKAGADSKKASVHFGGYMFLHQNTPLKPPKLTDIIYSLMVDSSVLDSSGFEDWCDDFGYDSDSIKAKGIYDACMETALKVRHMIDLEEAQEVFQDY